MGHFSFTFSGDFRIAGTTDHYIMIVHMPCVITSHQQGCYLIEAEPPSNVYLFMLANPIFCSCDLTLNW